MQGCVTKQLSIVTCDCLENAESVYDVNLDAFGHSLIGESRTRLVPPIWRSSKLLQGYILYPPTTSVLKEPMIPIPQAINGQECVVDIEVQAGKV